MKLYNNNLDKINLRVKFPTEFLANFLKSIHLFIIPIFFLCLFTACEVDEIENPNGPTLESLEQGATLADLRLLANGLEARMRGDMEFYYQTVSIVGREYYDLNGIDPRYTGELLGAQGGELDNNGFLTTRSFSARYRTIRNTNLLITATQNSNASLSTQEENGIIGYAKTIQAYELLLVLNRQYQNGCRLDVTDPDKLGPFVSYDEGLAGVAAILDEAATALADAGDAFVFTLSSGYSDYGMSEPSGFLTFNRALAARVALYQNNNAKVLTLLSASFMDLQGDLVNGVYHVFGSSGNDIANLLFYVPNADLYLVQEDWLTNAEEGDLRVSQKTTPLEASEELVVPVLLDGLSGTTQVSLYASNADPAPIIRNEELILIYAEANIGTNNTEAVNAINIIRTAAGLADYSGDSDDASLVNEILHQRRYSLMGEGHRWIDMRRYNRLDQIVIDRDGDVIHVQFPRPVKEEE